MHRGATKVRGGSAGGLTSIDLAEAGQHEDLWTERHLPLEDAGRRCAVKRGGEGRGEERRGEERRREEGRGEERRGGEGSSRYLPLEFFDLDLRRRRHEPTSCDALKAAVFRGRRIRWLVRGTCCCPRYLLLFRGSPPRGSVLRQRRRLRKRRQSTPLPAAMTSPVATAAISSALLRRTAACSRLQLPWPTG